MRSGIVMLALLFVFALVPALPAQPYPVGVQPNTHLYWYNPDSDIYYDPASGTYYWYENGQWISDEYPPDVYVDPDSWVMFSSNASVPYVVNDQIMSYYDSSGYFPLYSSDVVVFNIGVAPFIEHDFFHRHRFFDHDEEAEFRHGDRDRHDQMFHDRFGHHFDPRADFRERHGERHDGGESRGAGERGMRDQNREMRQQGNVRPESPQRSEMRRPEPSRNMERNVGTRGPGENIRRENTTPQRENVRRGETRGATPQMRNEPSAPRGGHEMRGAAPEGRGMPSGGIQRSGADGGHGGGHDGGGGHGGERR